MGGIYTIHTYFNAEQVVGVINAIVMLVGGASPDAEYVTLLRIAAMIGLFMAVTYGFCKARGEEAGMYLVMVAIFYATLFTPRVTVTVEDHGPGAGAPVAIDNVPLGLAFFASTTSQIGHYLTQRTETFFALPDTTLTISQGGLMGGPRALRLAQSASMPDPILAQDMINFMRDCINPELVTNPATVAALMQSTNIWADISATGPLNLVNPGRMVVLAGNAVANACNAAYLLIDTRLAPAADTEFQRIARMIFPGASPATANTLLGSMLPAAEGLIMTASATTAQGIRQRMMINMLQDTSSNMAQITNDPTAAQTALAHSMAASSANVAYSVMAKLAQETLPLVRNAIELVVLGVFPIVLVLVIIAGTRGGTVLRSYVLTMLWVQMWAPLYAIVNYVGTMASSKSLRASLAGTDGVSIANAAQLLNTTISTEAVTGLLTIAVPMIALAIVKGGEVAMTSVTGSLTGPADRAAAKTGEAVGSGNVSMGNTSWGNHSAYNVSANKTNTSFMYSGATLGQVVDGWGQTHHNAAGGAVGSGLETSFTPGGGNLGVSATGGKKVAASSDSSLATAGAVADGVSANRAQGVTGTFTQQDVASAVGAIVKASGKVVQGGQAWQTADSAQVAKDIYEGVAHDNTIANVGRINMGGKIAVSGAVGSTVQNSDSIASTSTLDRAGAPAANATGAPGSNAPQEKRSLVSKVASAASKLARFGLSADYGVGADQSETNTNSGRFAAGHDNKEQVAKRFDEIASGARTQLGSEATQGQRSALEAVLGQMASSVDSKYQTSLSSTYTTTATNTDGRRVSAESGATMSSPALATLAAKEVARERGANESDINRLMQTDPSFFAAVTDRAAAKANEIFTPKGQDISGPDGTNIKPLTQTPKSIQAAGNAQVAERSARDNKEAGAFAAESRQSAKDTGKIMGAPSSRVEPDMTPAETAADKAESSVNKGSESAKTNMMDKGGARRIAVAMFADNQGAVRLANTALFAGIGMNGENGAKLEQRIHNLARQDSEVANLIRNPENGLQTGRSVTQNDIDVVVKAAERQSRQSQNVDASNPGNQNTPNGA